MAWTEYNANTWTADELVSDVRRRARLSDEDVDFTASAIMREATDQIWAVAARVEAQARDGRAMVSIDRTVQTDAVSVDGASYVLPPMCAAGAVSSIFWVSDTGETVKLSAVSADREPDYGENTGTPQAYAMLDREIKLLPAPDDGLTGTLRILYQRRHPSLVASTSVRAVTTVATASSGTATKFTLASAPPAEMAVGAWVDLVGARAPHGIGHADAVITVVSGSDVTVSVPYATMTAVLDSTAGRNYMVSSGQSYFVHLPLEMRGCVAGLTTAAILGHMGDLQGSQRAGAVALQELNDISTFMQSRSRGTKEKIINRFSHMRTRMRGGW